jgi:hypothetical protein
MGQQLNRAARKVARTGMGAPVGSDIEYFDEITMLKAMEGLEICDQLQRRTLLGLCRPRSVLWKFVSGLALNLRQPVRDDRQWCSLLPVGSGVHQESLTVASSVVKPNIVRKLQPKQWLGSKHTKFIRRLAHLN